VDVSREILRRKVRLGRQRIGVLERLGSGPEMLGRRVKEGGGRVAKEMLEDMSFERVVKSNTEGVYALSNRVEVESSCESTTFAQSVLSCMDSTREVKLTD